MSEQTKSECQRRRIDLAFQRIVEDADFQKEALLIEKEFEQSDWEALQVGEGRSAQREKSAET